MQIGINDTMKSAACGLLAGLLVTGIVVANDWAELDGASGNILKWSQNERSFELLKETEYAPKTDIGQSRFTLHWDDKTGVIQIEEHENFSSLKGPLTVELMGISKADRKAMKAGKPFEARVATFYMGVDLKPAVLDGGNRVIGRFTPDEKAGPRSGLLEINGKSVAVKLRKRHWRVYTHTLVEPESLKDHFWKAEVHGDRKGQNFVVRNMKVWKLPDPRLADDPKLPRVLIIGDSISMNYFDVVKSELQGVVNLHRNQGNAFSTSQGVRNMELWLGNYKEAGFQWDVIQFNHGLHDLKQAYDAEKDEFGAYAVPLNAYQENLEKELGILKKTGARLIWCATTPIPNHNKGKYARRKGASLEFNQAAAAVIKRHPDVLVTDLYKVVDESSVFDQWRKGNDVHFYKKDERAVIGEAVAATIRAALKEAP